MSAVTSTGTLNAKTQNEFIIYKNEFWMTPLRTIMLELWHSTVQYFELCYSKIVFRLQFTETNVQRYSEVLMTTELRL
ncbi:MAG: hypothetical protein ACI8RD_003293 [Bacillariaceae sp.]|jgi:hypothetical protein